MKSARVSNFVVNPKPMTSKKKTKKKKVTKTAPSGAPVYGSRITNCYELRDDIELRPPRHLDAARYRDHLNHPEEPVYPSKRMVKPK